MKFGIVFRGGRYRIEVSKTEVVVSADAGNESAQPFIANGKSASVAPGASYSWTINHAERGTRHA